MIRNLQIGKAGLDAFQKKMDSIANNIANVQTTGYKKQNVDFEDLFYDTMDGKGIPLSQEAKEKGLEIGLGSKIKGEYRVFEQGNLEESPNPLDLAIKGEGFFGVYDKEGNLMLTRDGNFSLDKNGYLVDKYGNRVALDSNRSLSQWSREELRIDGEGNIIASNNQRIDKILLYSVEDKSLLVSKGNNNYQVVGQKWITNRNRDLGEIKQGYLEKSNVDIGNEMIQMIITQRAYQMNIKSVQSADEMWTMVNHLRK